MSSRLRVSGFSIAVLAAALFAAAPSAQQSCTVSINMPDFNAYERAGGPGAALLTASTPTCPWTVGSTGAWITFPNGNTGSGTAWLQFDVAPFPPGVTDRLAYLTLGGQTSNGIRQTTSGVVGTIEAPTGGTVVTPFQIAGWAMHDTGTGNDAVVDLYAYSSSTSPVQTFLGTVTASLPRQHVADRYGSSYLESGYLLDVPSLPAGQYRVRALGRPGTGGYYWDAGSTTFTVAAPALALNVSQVRGGIVRSAAATSASTPPQPVIISGIGAALWTATPLQPWISLSRTSGTGDGRFTVSFDFSSTALPSSGVMSGTIRVAASGAAAGVINLPVFVTIYQPGGTAPPFGTFESPAEGAINLSGAVPITGWALDDIGVQRVQIYRNPVAGESSGSLVYLGDAPNVEGARADVAAAFPGSPSSTSAGWGYMLLSNMLPGQGNGTFTLHAYAVDAEGQSRLLGSKTVTMENTSSTLPFGTLDFPAQGEVVSGDYTSIGWILTPQPASIRPDGSEIAVLIDGQYVGRPIMGMSRLDVAGFFPGLNNTFVSGGKYTFDTRLLKNGIHTIAWSVQDNLRRAQGIGSRYFIVNNP